MKSKLKYLLIPLLVIAAVASMIFIPRYLVEKDLKKLGYSKEAVQKIQELKITQPILDNGYYSPYINTCLENDALEPEYLALYTTRDKNNPLTAEDFNLYARLLDFGYVDRQLLPLFERLYFYEITPLLVFDYQYDLSYYIMDCEAHRDTNNQTSFTLSNSYITPYRIVQEADISRGTAMLINKSLCLPEDYAPEELAELPVTYAAGNMSLTPEAASALRAFYAAGAEAGAYFYVVASYRSYETQKTIYDKTRGNNTEAYADRYAIRPGFSEHQSGLAVNIAVTEKDVDYADSVAARWAAAHCYEYGWIERYPVSKAVITQVKDEPDHFRYVGREVASAVRLSHMTYDEFYALYLNDWEDESLKPAERILGKLVWYDIRNKDTEENTSEETSEKDTGSQ